MLESVRVRSSGRVFLLEPHLPFPSALTSNQRKNWVRTGVDHGFISTSLSMFVLACTPLAARFRLCRKRLAGGKVGQTRLPERVTARDGSRGEGAADLGAAPDRS